MFLMAVACFVRCAASYGGCMVYAVPNVVRLQVSLFNTTFLVFNLPLSTFSHPLSSPPLTPSYPLLSQQRRDTCPASAPSPRRRAAAAVAATAAATTAARAVSRTLGYTTVHHCTRTVHHCTPLYLYHRTHRVPAKF